MLGLYVVACLVMSGPSPTGGDVQNRVESGNTWLFQVSPTWTEESAAFSLGNGFQGTKPVKKKKNDILLKRCLQGIRMSFIDSFDPTQYVYIYKIYTGRARFPWVNASEDLAWVSPHRHHRQGDEAATDNIAQLFKHLTARQTVAGSNTTNRI